MLSQHQPASQHGVFGYTATFTVALLLLCVSGTLIAESYVDKNRYFSFAPPTGWSRTDFVTDPRSKVQFATGDAALVIIAYRPMNPSPIAAVKQNQEDQLKVLEQRAGARMLNVAAVEFAGRASVESSLEMQGQRLWMLHFFLPKDVFVTVTLSGDPRSFTRRLLEAKSSLATLKALDEQEIEPQTIRAQAIARLLYKGKIEVELGRYEQAEAAYRQVLELDPENKAARAGLEGLPRRAR